MFVLAILIFGITFQHKVYAKGAEKYGTFQGQKQLMESVIAPWKSGILSSFMDGKLFPTVSNDTDDIRFYLYTNPKKVDDYDELKFGKDSTLKNARWIKGAPVKVLAHGFTQNKNSSFPGMTRNGYLSKMTRGEGKYNIIVVDWGKLAFSLDSTLVPVYTSAVQNVEVVGVRTGDLLVRMKSLNLITKLQDVHLIGFSLGAHVVGQAGLQFQTKTGKKLGRITGLDPAGPMFYTGIFKARELRDSDAEYVDVIHTSWGTYGIAKNIGYADFHPNFETASEIFVQSQPYCYNVINILKEMSPIQVCSHSMAPVFFTMSLYTDKLQGCQNKDYVKGGKCNCKSNAPFGEDWYKSKLRGNFYMDIPISCGPGTGSSFSLFNLLPKL